MNGRSSSCLHFTPVRKRTWSTCGKILTASHISQQHQRNLNKKEGLSFLMRTKAAKNKSNAYQHHRASPTEPKKPLLSLFVSGKVGSQTQPRAIINLPALSSRPTSLCVWCKPRQSSFCCLWLQGGCHITWTTDIFQWTKGHTRISLQSSKCSKYVQSVLGFKNGLKHKGLWTEIVTE